MLGDGVGLRVERAVFRRDREVVCEGLRLCWRVFPGLLDGNLGLLLAEQWVVGDVADVDIGVDVDDDVELELELEVELEPEVAVNEAGMVIAIAIALGLADVVVTVFAIAIAIACFQRPICID